MTDLTFPPDPRPLGKSGIIVSPLAWGMWRFAGRDLPTARTLVDAVLAAGITFFDTADIYGCDTGEFGDAELLLGRVFAEDRSLRDRIVLATKGGIRLGVPYDSSDGWLERALDDSLRRLGVDQVDLWQVHRRDLLTHPAKVARAFERMVASGKVRAVGVSNHSAAETAAIRAFLPFHIATTQPEFSPLATRPLFDGVLDQAMTMGMTPMAWSPLAGGRLGDVDGDPRADAVKALLDAKAEQASVDRAAVVYAWIGAHPAGIAPIVGTQDPARIARAADAHRVSFSRAEWYAILQAGIGERLP